MDEAGCNELIHITIATLKRDIPQKDWDRLVDELLKFDAVPEADAQWLKEGLTHTEAVLENIVRYVFSFRMDHLHSFLQAVRNINASVAQSLSELWKEQAQILEAVANSEYEDDFEEESSDDNEEREEKINNLMTSVKKERPVAQAIHNKNINVSNNSKDLNCKGLDYFLRSDKTKTSMDVIGKNWLLQIIQKCQAKLKEEQDKNKSLRKKLYNFENDRKNEQNMLLDQLSKKDNEMKELQVTAVALAKAFESQLKLDAKLWKENTKHTEEIWKLQSSVSKLKDENYALRKENKLLKEYCGQ